MSAVVIPGRRTRMVLDLVSFVACILLTILQLGTLDYYFIHYLDDPIWYAWIAGDVLVLAAFLLCLVFAVRYNQRCMEEVCNHDANIRFAWLAWLVYSLVLAGKVAVTFRLFHNEIRDGQGFGSVDEFFGRHTFKLTLSLTAIIFLLLVESHHYTRLESPRQLYLTYLATAITLDILDSILFLDTLWDVRVRESGALDFPLEIAVLVLACANFAIPTFALLKLTFKRMPRYVPLPYEKMYSLIYVLIVNVPYIVIRAYLWRYVEHHDVSIFLVKNAIMIYLAIRDVWTRIQYWRQKKALASGSATNLTGTGNGEEQHRLSADKAICS